MIVLNARNVNGAYANGMRMLNARGRQRNSRNGPVIRMSDPVTTIYTKPTERVLFDERRDANPFFHLFESLWMLNGGNDLETITRFLPSFAQFSDDGTTLNGAYGHRWRHYFMRHQDPGGQGFDQLQHVIEMLRGNQNDRRVVISMWDAVWDLHSSSKDVPCNDMIKVSIEDGALNIVVFCRSNDIVFGCYGANAVHMSMLQEYLAGMIGVPVGVYEQISCDYHAYLETPYHFSDYFPLNDSVLGDGYNGYSVFPLIEDAFVFDRELCDVMTLVRSWKPWSIDRVYQNSFFTRVVGPMYQAIRAHKNGDTRFAISLLNDAQHIDWLVAGQQWLARRLDRRPAK